MSAPVQFRALSLMVESENLLGAGEYSMMLTLLECHHTPHILWRGQGGLVPLPAVMRRNG